MFVIRSSTAFMSAQIVGQSGGVPQLRRLFSWRRAPARMDSDSDIEIVEPVNKKGTHARLRSLFSTIPNDKETDNLAHVKACKDKDCARCLYFRNIEKWQHKLPIVQDEFQAEDLPMKYTTESWLDDRVDSKTGTWGLGCICCEAQLQEQQEKTEDVAVGVSRLRKVHMQCCCEIYHVDSPPQPGRARSGCPRLRRVG